MKLNEQDIRRIFQQRPTSGLTAETLTDVALGRAALTQAEVENFDQADLAALRLSNELSDWTDALAEKLEATRSRPTLSDRLLGWLSPDGTVSLGRLAPLGGAAALVLAVAATVQLSPGSGPNAIVSAPGPAVQESAAAPELITRSGFEAPASVPAGDGLLFQGSFENTDTLFAAGSFEART